MAPYEQRNSSCDPTPTPTEHTATDGAATVMDEHREAGVEPARESLSNQRDLESEISDSGTLEESGISDDLLRLCRENPITLLRELRVCTKLDALDQSEASQSPNRGSSNRHYSSPNIVLKELITRKLNWK